MGEPLKALKEFNKAKRLQAYAEESLNLILDLFLNPNQDVYFSFSEEMNYIRQIDPVFIKITYLKYKGEH
jgi:hypothetical protein